MENIMYDEILTNVDKLVDMIMTSEKYKRYAAIKDKMSHNDVLMDLLSQYKKIQQQLVKSEYRKQEEQITLYTKKLKNLDNQLKKIPIYSEYILLQEELNEEFQLLKDDLENHIIKKLNQEEF